MSAAERENFELILLFHEELKRHVADLQSTAATLALASVRQVAVPPATLRARLFASLDRLPARTPSPAVVVTDGAGLVEWINPAFSAMCGYSLDELRGRKPGTVLQGAATDRSAVARIREAVRLRRECTETLVNYHKNGSRYLAEVKISPVLDEDHQPLWFVARERVLASEAELAAG